MIRAEEATRAADKDMEVFARNGDEINFKLAQLGYMKAQTLWAQAQFYGTVG